MLQVQQEQHFPHNQQTFPRSENGAGVHVHTQAGFQVPPGIRAELAIRHTVREGSGDGAGREGHHLRELLEADAEDSQVPLSPHQGAAVLPHIDADALGKGQG